MSRLDDGGGQGLSALADEESVVLAALANSRAEGAADLAGDEVAGSPGGAGLVLGESPAHKFTVDEFGVTAGFGFAAGGGLGFRSSLDDGGSSRVVAAVVPAGHVQSKPGMAERPVSV